VPSHASSAFLPGWTLVVLVDMRERIAGDWDALVSQLTRLGLTCIRVPLNLGDVVWAVRHDATGRLVLLDAIVERKTLSDLEHSIRNANHFFIQRHRLASCGLSRRFYVIEQIHDHADFAPAPSSASMSRASSGAGGGGGGGWRAAVRQPPLTQANPRAVRSAIHSLETVFGYMVVRTKDSRHTIQFLADLTDTLREDFIAQHQANPDALLTPSSSSSLQSSSRSSSSSSNNNNSNNNNNNIVPAPPLHWPCVPSGASVEQGGALPLGTTFPDWNERMRKTGLDTMRLFFAQMLRMVRGVSGPRAEAIVNRFPTISHLIDAYNQCQSDAERSSLLANLTAGHSRRRIGPACSKDVAAFFTAQAY
jgi:ERCC4-type nuclease